MIVTAFSLPKVALRRSGLSVAILTVSVRGEDGNYGLPPPRGTARSALCLEKAAIRFSAMGGRQNNCCWTFEITESSEFRFAPLCLRQEPPHW